MREISYTVCDRCKKPFEYSKSKWAGFFKNGIIKKRNRFFFRELYYGNYDGYGYCDRNFELCADCTEKLKDFLNNKWED